MCRATVSLLALQPGLLLLLFLSLLLQLTWAAVNAGVCDIVQ